ncbi:hypothetical protein B2J93_5566 [Marssonina coronariae]|uniref:Uncharacterized protein n=1 Tax=Diplocarpon coronariae TaxID=2795749 RepID=A0A218Z213_9HELO|nr:hypothetical protein B2J93_5566 [Marssonina coronariae]
MTNRPHSIRQDGEAHAGEARRSQEADKVETHRSTSVKRRASKKRVGVGVGGGVDASSDEDEHADGMGWDGRGSGMGWDDKGWDEEDEDEDEHEDGGGRMIRLDSSAARGPANEGSPDGEDPQSLQRRTPHW